MRLSKSFYQSRARCTRIGSALLDGPDWIVPPVKIDKVRSVRKWPKTEIIHHILEEDEQEEIDRLLRKLDQTLSNVTFLMAGLITDWNAPNNCWAAKKVEAIVYLQRRTKEIFEYDTSRRPWLQIRRGG